MATLAGCAGDTNDNPAQNDDEDNEDNDDDEDNEDNDDDDGADIRIFDENAYYWTYDGEPTLLLGGSPNDNLYQDVGNPDVNVEGALDTLVESGGNYIRLVMQSRVRDEDKDSFIVQPFAAGNNGMYDLEEWNEEYWNRLETLLSWTAERDIVVQLTFWDRFDFTDHFIPTYRDHNPWNPANNVTYDTEEIGLPSEWDQHPNAVHPFMLAVEEHNQQLLAHQERYVERILEHTLSYDHVLYNVSNETRAPKSWGDHWADFGRAMVDETDAGSFYVTQMYGNRSLTDEIHDRTFKDRGTYDYIEVSQNNHQTGQTHYDNLMTVRERFTDRPWPMNNVKIYGADGGSFGDTQDALRRLWRNIAGGSASARFHRPIHGLGIGDLAQTHLRGAREVTDELDLANTEPRPDLLSDRSENEAYCLADNVTSLVFFIDGGSVTLEADRSDGATVRWYDIVNESWSGESEVESGSVELSAPAGYWVAVVS